MLAILSNVHPLDWCVKPLRWLVLDFLRIIGWEKWVGCRLPPQTPLFRGKSQSPTFAIEWKNRNHYFYRTAARRGTAAIIIDSCWWENGEKAPWRDPTNQLGLDRAKEEFVTFSNWSQFRQKLVGLAGTQSNTRLFAVTGLYCITGVRGLVGYEKVKRTRQSQGQGRLLVRWGDYGTSRNTKCQFQANQ